MSNYKIWQPMKYATARRQDILDAALASDRYGLQLKKDGSSYILAKDSDGSVHLYGDKISKKTGEIIDKIDNVPHLKEFAEKHFPLETQFIIEICYGDTSKDVNSIMLALPEKAIARQKTTRWAKAYVFDCLFYAGEEVFKKDYIDRYKYMTDFAAFDEDKNFEVAQLIIDNKKETLAQWLADGEEGGVLKLLRSEGKVSAAHVVKEIGETAARPMHTTYKVKQVDTIDCFITGVQLPTKEYTGNDPENHKYKDENGQAINRLYALDMINAFSIGVFDEDGKIVHIGTVSSGLDDEIRAAAFDNIEKYMNKVVEIVCMSKDSVNKTLRHPRFLRFREDKSAEQCLVNEVF